MTKSFESYVGCNVKLRYFVRATVFRRLTDVVKENDIIVHSLSSYPDTDLNLKMEVGIEDCLHIEFEYNRSRFNRSIYLFSVTKFNCFQISFERCYRW